MKRTILSFALGLSLMLLFAAFTNAQPMRMGGKQRPNGMMFQKMNFMKKLNLTDQQKEKIADLRISFQKQMIDLRADLQKSKLDLKALRLNDNLSRADVTAAVEKINKNRDAISLAVANHMMDVYEILTPDQRKIARQEMGMMFGQRKHMQMFKRMKGFNR